LRLKIRRENKKAINERLFNAAKEFIFNAKFRKEITMYSRLNPDASYDFTDIIEKVETATQLGYEVLITKSPNEKHYKIIYREKFPERPFKFKY